MKKAKYLAPLAVPTMVLAGGLFGNSTYAAGLSSVYLYYPSAEGNSTTCYLLAPSSSSNHTMCGSDVGSYDSTTNTVTLGNTGEAVLNIVAPTDTTPDAVTIKATQNQALNYISSSADLIFDIGEYKMTTSSSITSTGDITVKSGSYSVSTSGTKNLTIDSGSYYSNDKIMSTYDNLIVNGGSYSSNTGMIWINDSIKVTGGTVSGKEITLSSINDTKFELTGGTVNLETDGLVAISGYGDNKTEVVISGGELNIKGANHGITLEGSESTISFNGGTAKFTNVPTYAVHIDGNTNSENAIKFGQGIGIKEDHTYVFWTDDTFTDNYKNLTGIVSKYDTVTITNGYTVNKFKGWDIGEIDDFDPDSTDEDGVKVPDTGVSINSEEGGALSIFAVSTFVILSIIALATTFKKRSAGHFKFDK